MPALVPSAKDFNLSRSVDSVSKCGVNIEEIVGNSVRCDIRGKYGGPDSRWRSPITSRVARAPLTSLTGVASPNALKRQALKTTRRKLLAKAARFQRTDPAAEESAKRFDPARKENFGKEPVDDSLTSLQWLTGMKVDDILEGKPTPRHYTPPSPAPSGSSDDGDYKLNSVDYRTSNNVKPPYSYAVLIIMAIKSKLGGKMSLIEIYRWITDNFVYYRNTEPKWQNSIRHNLSLNKCFKKIPRKKGDPGKGGYWSIVPEFAIKLLENCFRKRCSGGVGADDLTKRLEVLESQVLRIMRAELKDDASQYEKSASRCHVINASPRVEQTSRCHTSRVEQTSVETLTDMENCRMDHSYGKSPVVNYDVADVENIRAIATQLEDTMQTVAGDYIDENPYASLNSSVFNDLRADCIWGSEKYYGVPESVSDATDELLRAQRCVEDIGDRAFFKTLNNSLNNSFANLQNTLFCLSPPVSGDDDEPFSDDIDARQVAFQDDDGDDVGGLMVRGTSVTLFQPVPEIFESRDASIKSEPPSPNSIDELAA